MINSNRVLYLVSFFGSLAIHFSLMEWPLDIYFNSHKPQDKPKIYNKVQIKFVDSYNEDKIPQRKSDMISNHNNIASQPEKPSKNLPKQGIPHTPKLNKSREIKTDSSIHQTEGKTRHVNAKKIQDKSPSSDSVEKTVPKKEKQEYIKEDVFNKKETEINKTPVVVAVKTIDSPKKKENISKKAKISQKQTVPQEDIASGGDSSQRADASPDSKIDELIHKASSDTESIAEIIDLIKFDIAKHELGDYYAKMKRKISRNWKTRIFMNYSSQMFSSEAIIIFRVEKDGNISELKCLIYNGNPFFKQDCESAVKESAKFDPIPDKYIHTTGKKNLWVYINFGYNTD